MDARIGISLPHYPLQALSALEDAGFEAWCVGGCVRDSLLGRAVNDYDIATSAPWGETERVLEASGFTVHRTGVKHGTVTASLDGHAMEITTYRTDGRYSDRRRPDRVDFVSSIEEDLARRDFTVNALAYHPTRGLLDRFGGRADLRNKVIRTVGEAHERFGEDALRILRACRFSSQLGFSLDGETFDAMMTHKTLMQSVSSERITHELQQLLLGDHVHDALMGTADVLSAVLPELVAMKGFEQHTPYHIYDVLEHTAYVVQHVKALPLLRWAALFHDMGKPGAFFRRDGVGHFYGHATLSALIAQGVMRRLRLSPSFAADVLALVRAHDDVIEPTPRAVKRALARFGGRPDLLRALCDLKRADAMAQAPQCRGRIDKADALEQVLDEVLAAEEAFTLGQLALNGHDVMALGIEAGPHVGALLQMVLDAVIDGRIPNDHAALVDFVRRELISR